MLFHSKFPNFVAGSATPERQQSPVHSPAALPLTVQSSSTLYSLLTNVEWRSVLHEEFSKPYFDTLEQQVLSDCKSFVVYPTQTNFFKALNYTPLSSVKVELR